MRYLRELREKRGISIRYLSRCSGVSETAIWNFEMERTEMKQNLRTRIAGILNSTVDEISRKSNTVAQVKEKVEKKITYKAKKCLNENCPLNKEKKCINDVVLSGRAPCFGKDLVKSKQNINYSNTKLLFRK